MTSPISRTIMALVLVVAMIWAGFLSRSHINGIGSLLDRFETVLLDLRIALIGQRQPPEDLIIVAIDDQTVAETGQYPLTRDHLSVVIENIRAAGAKALAIDILLPASSDEEQDAKVARSVGSIPTVLAAAGQVDAAAPKTNLVPAVTPALTPAPVLAASADVGLVNIVTDSGGTPRHIPMLFLTKSGLQQSFSLRSTSLYLEKAPTITASGLRLNGQDQALDLGWHLALNYYGPGGTLPTISASRFLKGPGEFAARLQDRLVVLGVTATAVGDRFGTPFDPVMPGVEVQATGMANLLDGTHLIRDSDTRLYDVAAAAIITLTGLAAVFFLPLATASFVYLFLLSGWLVVIFVAFMNGLWLNGALPIAASLPPVIGLMIARQIAEKHRSRQALLAQEALGRFQSPGLARRIAEDPGFLQEPREQDTAILFVDLSGYTSASEQLGAVKTRDFLKAFHTIVVDMADANDGVVLDFMGDGAMLGFGVPDPGRKDPLNAIRCAFQLEMAVADWLDSSGMKTEIDGVRVGAHFGRIVLSRLGHDRQQQIATTGDSVNVASRLLDVAKSKGAAIVLSADLIDATETAIGTTPDIPRLETVSIRGRRQELSVGLWNTGQATEGLQAFAITVP